MFDILSFYLCGTEEEVYVYICGVWSELGTMYFRILSAHSIYI